MVPPRMTQIPIAVLYPTRHHNLKIWLQSFLIATLALLIQKTQVTFFCRRKGHNMAAQVTHA